MSVSKRICAQALAFIQFAALIACSDTQGQETGRDPRIPITLKQPQSETTAAPGPSSSPNLNSGSGTEDTPLPSSPQTTPSNPPSDVSDSSAPSDTASSTTPAQPSNPTDPASPATPPVSPVPSQPLPPQTPKRSTLTVMINGLHNERGNVCLSLFNSPEGFPDSDSKAVLAECFEVIARSFEIKIESVPPGTYAIALWHDENRDKKLNYNFLGIPKEGLAFSERGKPRITPPPGPPSFNSISFEIKEGESKTTETQMTYLLDLL